MKRRTICISDKQDKEFHQLVKEQGLTFSELIRRALDEYLRKQKRYGKS
ncbi:ribbon-helix-helix protein, CopG family [bacterium]|nr:ribbon-helix-helix protein, CopG family [bacterium]